MATVATAIANHGHVMINVTDVYYTWDPGSPGTGVVIKAAVSSKPSAWEDSACA